MKDYSIKDQIYCYENTLILKNKLNIKNKEELEIVETKITSFKIAELQKREFKEYNLNFLFFKNLHKFIFEDLFEWAGKIRIIDISKDSFKFAHHIYIEKEASKLFNQLKKENYLKNIKKEDLIKKISHYITEINVLHPFREGNGRTIREYFRILLQNLDYKINFNIKNKQKYIEAMIESPYDQKNLIKFLKENIKKLEEK
ncbi:Fic/DOC family protein [Oceanotoga teriensis]|jgi:cell filamentation protein|uniref:protein adenylyltransferase n=1 Tax=Oceanotoga teriensis TaxID=515440 RepID=A0AA45C4H1_9BACT|nr:Fic family protein [Oceanotoga teriensis]MDO7975772.1 Fic family protein [Oceanotoga teriensis]PWJ85146.1 cell filamentation protein [Oceanotoga teriensis]